MLNPEGGAYGPQGVMESGLESIDFMASSSHNNYLQSNQPQMLFSTERFAQHPATMSGQHGSNGNVQPIFAVNHMRPRGGNGGAIFGVEKQTPKQSDGATI